jgi:hypothetical protein
VRIGARVVGDGGCDGQPEQEPEAEEKSDRELLGALRRDIEAE